MPKITRYVQNLFGNLVGAAGNYGKFGSLAAGVPQYTKDPKEIQSLDAWNLGWNAATVGNKSPALQDRNALDFLAFYQLAYLMQQGVPEWNADTTYYIGGICASGGSFYVSITDDNINHAVSDTNHWLNQAAYALQFRYPVGEVFITHRSGNPAALLGFGTWIRYGEGRSPMFLSTSDTDFDAIDKTYGEKNHTLTIGEIPPVPTYGNLSGTAGANPIWANVSSVGGGQAHNTTHQVIVLAAWLRTA
jgi:hypothetical protein